MYTLLSPHGHVTEHQATGEGHVFQRSFVQNCPVTDAKLKVEGVTRLFPLPGAYFELLQNPLNGYRGLIFLPSGKGCVFVCCGLFVAQSCAVFKLHQGPSLGTVFAYRSSHIPSPPSITGSILHTFLSRLITPSTLICLTISRKRMTSAELQLRIVTCRPSNCEAREYCYFEERL